MRVATRRGAHLARCSMVLCSTSSHTSQRTRYLQAPVIPSYACLGRLPPRPRPRLQSNLPHVFDPVMAKQKKEEGAQFVRFFGPLLDALRALGGSGTPDEVVERIAQDLALSDDVQNELLPSGDLRYRNQVAWAHFYLVREGLLDSSKRGVGASQSRGSPPTLRPSSHAKFFGSGSAYFKSSVAPRQTRLNWLLSKRLMELARPRTIIAVKLLTCCS